MYAAGRKLTMCQYQYAAIYSNQCVWNFATDRLIARGSDRMVLLVNFAVLLLAAVRGAVGQKGLHFSPS